MLGIFFKILCILGWFLLTLLILLLILLFLLLFYPVSYRILWESSPEKKNISIKASWLLGILKVRYHYPVPGTVTAKLFGITLFDSGKTEKKSKPDKKSRDPAPSSPGHDTDRTEQSKEAAAGDEAGSIQNLCRPAEAALQEEGLQQEDAVKQIEAKPGFMEKIRSFFENILNKFRGIIEKIKNIVSQAEYYLELLKEEDTKQLFSHVFLRSGKIIKSIRPRKIKGQILLGTGSPDTTGYAMALYGMLSPYLGQNLTLTPDFEEKVLEGQLSIKGRIMLCILLVNGLKVAVDKKFHSFTKKLKREVK